MEHDRLFIPLQPIPTRRVDRRVVWLLARCLIISLFVILGYKIWITRDLTSFLRPDNTQTVRIFKNAKTTLLLHDHIGTQQMIPGSPLSIDDILDQSVREFSVHFDNTNIIGITVDRAISQELVDVVKSYGLISVIEDEISYIGLETPMVQHGNRFGVNIFSDGLIISKDHKNIGNVYLNSSSLTVKGIGLSSGPAIINQTNDLSVAISFPANTTKIPQILEASLGIDSHMNLIQEVERVGGSISIGNDKHGQTIAIFIPSQEFTTEELAQLGKEVMSRSNLTTLELTNPDGSSVLELFSNSKEIKSEITTDKNQTKIVLLDSAGNSFNITSNNEGVSLSNRANDQFILDLVHKSSCLRSANSFIKPKLILKNEHRLITQFSEIAWRSSSIRFCW